MSPDEQLPDPFAVVPPEAPPSDASASPPPAVVSLDGTRAFVRDDSKPGWVEFSLTDEDGLPAAGEAYRVRMPDGSLAEGTLDDNGFLRLSGFTPGECEICFPDLDRTSWRRV